ncbi:MAG: type II secretion system protein [Bacilli bacterium]|nr:type II secretion system protein [Bacilli bacterium]
MKKNAFTLIELIGVVVILSIIALIVFPATLSVLQKGQNDVNESVKQVVILAAGKYVNENKDNYPKQIGNNTENNLKNNGTVSTETLLDDGYIEADMYKKHNLEGSCVTVKSNSKKYFYEYNEGCK